MCRHAMLLCGEEQCVVMQCSFVGRSNVSSCNALLWGGAMRDNTNNGCKGDYHHIESVRMHQALKIHEW